MENQTENTNVTSENQQQFEPLHKSFCRECGTMISEKAKTLADIKLNDTLISILILSFFCGILMYLAVNTYKEVKDIGKYLAVFLGVIVFILCGFEHCIANMYYFSVSSTWSLNTLLYLLVMILGNSLGGILIPLCNKVIKKG